MVCAAVSEASASPGNVGIVYVVYCLCVATCVAVSGGICPADEARKSGHCVRCALVCCRVCFVVCCSVWGICLADESGTAKALCILFVVGVFC